MTCPWCGGDTEPCGFLDENNGVRCDRDVCTNIDCDLVHVTDA